MKSFFRWSAALSLVGTVVVGSLFAGALRVLALTDAEVAEQLRRIPVFTITNSEGVLLVATPSQEQNAENSEQPQAPIANIFINQQDAQSFLSNLSQSNPDIARDVQVTPLSLAEVYELARADREPDERIEFMFIPGEQDVQSAISVLRQGGQNIESFRGVPLFYLAGENGSWIKVQRGNEEFIPMFFEQSGVENLLNTLRAQQPDLTTTTSIGVGSLENLIQRLHDNQDPQIDQLLTQIVLIPPVESLEFIRSLQQQQEGQPQQPPAQRPTP